MPIVTALKARMIEKLEKAGLDERLITFINSQATTEDLDVVIHSLHNLRVKRLNIPDFSEELLGSVREARKEAVRLRHEYIGTEHLLLGITAVSDCVAAEVLKRLRYNLARVTSTTEAIIGKGKAGPSSTAKDLPYTSRAKTVINLAREEMCLLDHAHLGTEHILLGLIREEKGIAAQILLDTYPNSRQATIGQLLERCRRAVTRVTHTKYPTQEKIAQHFAQG